MVGSLAQRAAACGTSRSYSRLDGSGLELVLPISSTPYTPHEFMYKRGSYRHTWHPTLRALGVASMQPGGRLDVQEHTRNARSRSLA